MCADGNDVTTVAQRTMPQPVEGEAVDPITLEPVDELTVTTLVDNSYDALLVDDGPARRKGSLAAPPVPADQFDGGVTYPGLVAEHGFSALVTVRRGDRTHTVLYDTGISPDGLADNIERLGLDVGAIEAVVLSHGHFDHAGGFLGLSRFRGRSGLPITVHPLVWSRRRIVFPGKPVFELPTLRRSSLEAEGFDVVERRQPSVIIGGSVLVTGEVDRTTDFEIGMPYHEANRDGRWEPDPLILDDQALVVHVRDVGLAVLTGCGHAGVVNIARHAMRLTGVDRLHGLVGGFHLSGPGFEPVIGPTVEALLALAPGLVVPGHCSGWKAQHKIAAALPESFLPNAVGTSFVIGSS
jgi:7,8-dihydropterin-6-yl-methyl-4-(beta-D-ribofuranosyl)aminobenzene 5'-phosphate synthase